MMFKTSEFVISIEDLRFSPNKENFFEYAFLGRSNVGKSSLINALCNKKKLARVSSDPGKTITINYYLIDSAFYLVDLPGYGYSRRSKSVVAKLKKMLAGYLKNSLALKKCFLVIDTKVGPTDKDILMYQRLKELKKAIVIVLAKSDKVGSASLALSKKKLSGLFSGTKLIVTSSFKKTGLEELRQAMVEVENGNFS